MSVPPRATQNSSGRPHLVWLLTGDKAGDRAQLLALAEALGWPYTEKRLWFNRHYHRSNIWLGASLRSLDAAKSNVLDPPWPDLLLASGRRTVPVARWIKRQANGRTKLVHIGRPWAPLSLFDLVISTAQYQLPARTNVLMNNLTLNRHPADILAAAAARWTPVFSEYPRPLIGVLVGGNARPFVFDRDTATALARAAKSMADSLGGSLLVVTSRRSGEAATDALFAELPANAFLHRFQSAQENPYHGILALADRFIVTGDSASMLSEACLSGKPVHMFSLPEEVSLDMRVLRAARRICLGRGGGLNRFLARVYEALLNVGIVAGSTRDMRLFHQTLMANGLVRSWNDLSPTPIAEPMDDLAKSVDRIQALY